MLYQMSLLNQKSRNRDPPLKLCQSCSLSWFQRNSSKLSNFRSHSRIHFVRFLRKQLLPFRKKSINMSNTKVTELETLYRTMYENFLLLRQFIKTTLNWHMSNKNSFISYVSFIRNETFSQIDLLKYALVTFYTKLHFL